jgi:hypothetical protein
MPSRSRKSLKFLTLLFSIPAARTNSVNATSCAFESLPINIIFVSICRCAHDSAPGPG